MTPFGSLGFPSATPHLWVILNRRKDFSSKSIYIPKLKKQNPVIEGFSVSDTGERIFSCFQLVLDSSLTVT